MQLILTRAVCVFILFSSVFLVAVCSVAAVHTMNLNKQSVTYNMATTAQNATRHPVVSHSLRLNVSPVHQVKGITQYSDSSALSSLCPPGASDLRDQAHDQHPADDDLPEPEKRLLPAPSARRQAGPPLPRCGSPDPARGGGSADREEEARSQLPPQERAQGQGPLFH